MQRILIIMATLAMACAGAVGQLQTLTQSLDNNNVSAGTAIACNFGAPNFENAGTNVMRTYNLPNEGVFTDIEIHAVRFGVDGATSPGGAQDVTVTVYLDPTPGNPAPIIDLIPLHSQVFSVPDMASGIFTATLSTPVLFLQSANADIVAEVSVDNGQAAVEAFFVGANTAGETAPGYYMATLCGQPQPVDISTLGFTSHYIIDLEYMAANVLRPGTGDDLVTLMGVNAELPALANSRTLTVGDVATMTHLSPSGSMVQTGPVFVIGTILPTVGPTIPEPFAGLYVDAANATAIVTGSVAGIPLLLPAGGLTYSFAYPGGLGGFSVYFQCIISTSVGVNGILAGSNSLEVQFL